MSIKKNQKSKKIGKDLIKLILPAVPEKSGIYKMLDSKNKIIYIGKAKKLKSRIKSYSNSNLMPRTNYMVSQISNIEWILTKDEQDALLLESSLIKQFKPKFNILLKDDKTFPFIKIDNEHKFPAISKIREKQGSPNSNTFGPFASSSNVDENIKSIQKLFQIRNCSNHYFNTRKQPCILYQIKRCSAPCVQKISHEDYNNSVKQAILFLQGNNQSLKQELTSSMLQASKNNNFEQAIVFRERIKSLAKFNSSQSILLDNNENSDFIALLTHNDTYIFKVFIFKNSHHYGNLDFINKINMETTLESSIEYFIIQFYDNRTLPDNIYINITLPPNQIIVLQHFLKQKHGKKVVISTPKRKKLSEVMDIVINNAIESLNKYEEHSLRWKEYFDSLKNYFSLPKDISKIEMYDNSHLYGTFALGAMISVRVWGFEKKEYRTFHVKDNKINTTDDYAILYHILTRRFSRMIKEKQEFPDLIIIDGGIGQLNIAIKVLNELNISNIKVVTIAKGIKRNSGEETLFLDTGEVLHLNKFSSTLHFLQMIRNEAHRYAVKSVSKRKISDLSKSDIDNIPNIGSKRKKELINHFGSLDNIRSASMNDLSQVKGISLNIAKNIFNYFN